MEILVMAVIVLVIGMVGGLINALISDNGFLLPKTERADGIEVFRPGAITTCVIGGFAALVSWALYGPLSTTVFV